MMRGAQWRVTQSSASSAALSQAGARGAVGRLRRRRRDAVELVADELRVVLDDAGPPRVPGPRASPTWRPRWCTGSPGRSSPWLPPERRGWWFSTLPLPPRRRRQGGDRRRALAAAGVAQVPTIVTSDELGQVAGAAELIGYPVVAKRTHGAQGVGFDWSGHAAELSAALADLAADGPSALVLQRPRHVRRDGSGSHGARDHPRHRHGGRVVAATERAAHPDDFRTNVHLGGRQHAVGSHVQSAMAAASAAALGSGTRGWTSSRRATGQAILEVNASP